MFQILIILNSCYDPVGQMLSGLEFMQLRRSPGQALGLGSCMALGSLAALTFFVAHLC